MKKDRDAAAKAFIESIRESDPELAAYLEKQQDSSRSFSSAWQLKAEV